MTQTTRTRALALITITPVLLTGCTATAVGSDPTTTPQPTPEVTVNPTPTTPATPVGAPTVLASDLTTPWSAVFVGETALISSRDTGEILELTGDTTRVVGTVPGVVQPPPVTPGKGRRARPRQPRRKILRITPDGGIPDDNPLPGSLVYSLGHRNPQGIAWDADGRLFASEFGQDTWDELNIITPGGNYGWPEVEGIGGDPHYIDPVQQWSPDDASPSGITIVNGSLFIANLRGETLRAVPVADPTTATDYYTGEYGRIRDVAHAPDGSLWFLTSNTDSYGTPSEGNDRILRVELGQ